VGFWLKEISRALPGGEGAETGARGLFHMGARLIMEASLTHLSVFSN
jgi:hypothetical protein